ncbi:hypothetical protein FNYG_01177 [Fusarium nygamai]|uniref:Protein-arginine deiminase C-terminal domain-containing protein n=1 Tax=Gibberella nygamai TaxID=42673 RepID=A0A2K0WST1_GIBNY|nr:hypothetical protein FNYG_01177 [Fusarium nygamai]
MGQNGTVSIRIMILCPRTKRDGGLLLFLSFRKAGVGAVQDLGMSSLKTNAGGNIEAIPPYTFKGKTWPAGRLIVGKYGNESHDILSYLEAQESQKPLRLDTSWLAVGHVDEFVQFIPANNTRSRVVVISDPSLAIRVLEEKEKDGHGSIPAISRKNDTQWSQHCKMPECAQPVNSITVSKLLSNKRLRSLNDVCARKINGTIKILKKEVGLTDEVIICIPFLFIEIGSKKFEGPGSEFKVGAFFPPVINNLLLTGYNTCLAPNPWCLVVEGKDIFVEEINNTYAKVGMKVKFIDDWNSIIYI